MGLQQLRHIVYDAAENEPHICVQFRDVANELGEFVALNRALDSLHLINDNDSRIAALRRDVSDYVERFIEGLWGADVAIGFRAIG